MNIFESLWDAVCACDASVLSYNGKMWTSSCSTHTRTDSQMLTSAYCRLNSKEKFQSFWSFSVGLYGDLWMVRLNQSIQMLERFGVTKISHKFQKWKAFHLAVRINSNINGVLPLLYPERFEKYVHETNWTRVEIEAIARISRQTACNLQNERKYGAKHSITSARCTTLIEWISNNNLNRHIHSWNTLITAK